MLYSSVIISFGNKTYMFISSMALCVRALVVAALLAKDEPVWFFSVLNEIFGFHWKV